ncbi:hypothetical protein [Blastococcus brunescens]|uniref:EamA domain-containing protein n=1 Tax=Blastococcus brunescens TaxID=1564165 RepID=A0ABZ1B1V3_9ACTN|nr:hypothetical protein [Blastococcus sp. BMG 8361]WRL64724.1 hypothetical protein U6N30_02790 [Blastococcus sp. BMG 8361]
MATVRVGAAAFLMVASTVVWRRGEVFSGSVDPVVLGKALCSVLALAFAFLAAQAAGSRRSRLGTGTLWFVGAVLVSSVLGAFAHGTLVASAVIAVRVAILAATVFFLLRAAPLPGPACRGGVLRPGGRGVRGDRPAEHVERTVLRRHPAPASQRSGPARRRRRRVDGLADGAG